jgi:hypothetical protein
VDPRYIADAIVAAVKLHGYIELKNFWFGREEELPAALEAVKRDGYKLLLDANRKVVGVSR